MKNGIFLAACLVLAGLVSSVSFAQAPNNNGQPLGLAQNNPQQQGNVPLAAAPARVAAAPAMMPQPFQISPAEAKHIDQILTFWEFRSKKVHHYETNFERWQYDSVFGPADPDVHKTYSTGVIKYEQPDKGMFKVEQTNHFTPPQAGEKPKYEPRPGEVNEQWVCDGQSIFEFDAAAKQLKIWPLPPEQQGLAITNGPLPFLFGAKKQEILSRFYLRVSPYQKQTDKEYWLEAWPKDPADAAEYRFISILIDAQEFLPYAIEVYDRNFNPQPQQANQRPNFSRTVYRFNNRKTYEEGGLTASLQQIFKGSFYQPELPKGWQRVVQNNAPAGGAGGQIPANAGRPQQQLPR